MLREEEDKRLASMKKEEEDRLRREIEEKKQKDMEEKRRRLAEVEQKRQAADKVSKVITILFEQFHRKVGSSFTFSFSTVGQGRYQFQLQSC